MSRPRPAWRPAPREGVGASCVALSPGPWLTVAEFLAWRLPAVSMTDWQARMARGDVLDAQGLPVPPEAPYRPHSTLWYWRELPAEAHIPFDAQILFRDEQLLVVDKPHFLPMTPKGRYARETLLARLQKQTGLDTLVPIHRLDRETAGVVIFSIRPDDRAAYQSLFRDRVVHKVYEALAPVRDDLQWPMTRASRLATSDAHFMQVTEVAGEVNAITHIDMLRRVPGTGASEGQTIGHYQLSPHTGRTHQLRVHMHALGLPLLGDGIYPVLKDEPPVGVAPDYSRPLQLLARSIRFDDPVTGEARSFNSLRSLSWPDFL
ncbi:MAG: pseudouridine synthase [Burkholderiales bacterium PBB6]|nr:MAG: pseudouridine synthase [Burkholderiales bacterium PBB6]